MERKRVSVPIANEAARSCIHALLPFLPPKTFSSPVPVKQTMPEYSLMTETVMAITPPVSAGKRKGNKARYGGVGRSEPSCAIV